MEHSNMKNLWDIKIVILKFAENRNFRSGFISNDYMQFGFKETECDRVWESKCETAGYDKGSNESSYSIKGCLSLPNDQVLTGV
jgi:hypothetical protein